MKGDFTRDTFDKKKHFSRVLLQQGRVQLDADFNEQAAILLHRQQTLAADLIGPHGAPPASFGDPDGFQIMHVSENNFTIGKGHYYVDGILCENDAEVPYKTQPAFTQDPNTTLPATPFFVYLDVWERHLTYVELEDLDGSSISIRESALKGADTATRAQVVWQVKIADKLPEPDGAPIPLDATCEEIQEKHWSKWVENWQRTNRGSLKAKAVETQSPEWENPCITPPEARYRGPENQLYRVEIHKPGTAGTATFKWSRDNGSVIFPVRQIAGQDVTLEHLGRDGRFGLQENDWVEIVDDDYTLNNRAEPLLQVTKIDADTNTVTLDRAPMIGTEATKHPLLRRWDHQGSDDYEGAILIEERTTEAHWIELEQGIQIQLQPAADGSPAHQYRSGDYWLIPARTATGDVEWPGTVDDPEALPPHGIEHHYAPLCFVPVLDDDDQLLDCRNKISRGIDPDDIGALAVGNYLKIYTTFVVFNDSTLGSAPINPGFRPLLILSSGTCSAILGGKWYGGPVSGFANLRDGLNTESMKCSGIHIEKGPGTEWIMDSSPARALLYGHFMDITLASVKHERLRVTIDSVSDTSFTVTLDRLQPVERLDGFKIFLSLCCLG